MRNHNHKSVSMGLAITALCAGALALAAPGKAQVWEEQGPGPICQGANTVLPSECDTEKTVTPNENPTAGAINAIAPSPTESRVVFAGTVSGGVWKTSNATDPVPTWTPLTDKQLPQLPINSLAMSPVNSLTLFAGTGSTTNFLRFGSLGIGVARSTDGGTTWTLLARSTFTGRAINSIVPTTLTGFAGTTILAATWLDGGGVYRSIDNGVTFTRISGNGTSGLPNAGVTSLIADRSHAMRFYAGVPQGAGGGMLAGVYRSVDGGVTWTAVNTGLSGLEMSRRILLTVHSGAPDNAVYAAVIAADGTLSGVFRSANQGGNWTSLGVPSPSIYPGKQGATNGAFAADPSNANVVFISGDRQVGTVDGVTFPNGNGCTSYSSNVFRWNGTAWENVVCDGANKTSPHADSRFMAFDAGGNLLQANDGGIVRLESPNTASARKWVAIDGNIKSAEFHSIAYDTVSNIVFGGTQDNGTAVQSKPGNFTWMGLLGGDGGVVGVDASNPNQSFRYSSFQRFGFFNRSTWDATNKMLAQVAVGLNIMSGPGEKMTLFQFDKNIQFYQPFVLNAIDPSRMLIGTNQLYESLNRGDSLDNLGCLEPLVNGQCVGALVGNEQGYGRPIAYGSRLDGVAKPDVFYVGAGNQIFHRVTAGGLITRLDKYPGGVVITVAMNPNNYKQVFVSDLNNKIWGSGDEGASWSDMTFDLPSLTGLVTTIEVFSPDATLANTVVIGGGFGVFRLSATGKNWTRLSGLNDNFPPALVLDFHYDYSDSVLVAGTLGRGSWTIAGPFSGAIARSKVLPRPSRPVSSLPLLHLPPAPPPSANVPPSTARFNR